MLPLLAVLLEVRGDVKQELMSLKGSLRTWTKHSSKVKGGGHKVRVRRFGGRLRPNILCVGVYQPYQGSWMDPHPNSPTGWGLPECFSGTIGVPGVD